MHSLSSSTDYCCGSKSILLCKPVLSDSQSKGITCYCSSLHSVFSLRGFPTFTSKIQMFPETYLAKMSLKLRDFLLLSDKNGRWKKKYMCVYIYIYKLKQGHSANEPKVYSSPLGYSNRKLIKNRASELAKLKNYCKIILQ